MFVREQMDIERLIRVASKKEPADLVLKDIDLINVFSHEIYTCDIAVAEGSIAGLGQDYKGTESLNMKGKFACPGFIDGHLHVESSMVPIHEFARSVVPNGTTTIVIDPHEIANVMGMSGISYMLKSSKYNPLNVYIMLPSCVPATTQETSGADLKALDLFPILQDKWVLGLGEVMNYPGVLNCNQDVLDKIKIAQGKIIDGHAPGMTGPELNAYVAAGMRSDHECTTVEEAMEKLRLGMHIMIREGSTTKNLHDLLPLVTDDNRQQCIFVTDDRSPSELMDEGHIDHMIREAIEWGLDPISAIQMATINTANYFGLKNLGAVAPGNVADIVILDDLRTVSIDRVYKSGICVAENNTPIYSTVDHANIMMRGSVNVKWIEREHLQIEAVSDTYRVIDLVPDQIVTRCTFETNPKTKDGLFVSDPSRDILKLVVIERHYNSGQTGIGMIRGFGMKSGAMASTISHDSHNIIAVGVDDEEIYQAIVQLVRQQGGLAVADKGTVLDCLPLPIGGLMADRPIPEVRSNLDNILTCVRNLGSPMAHPFMTLSFMALPVIPELKLTDKGLFDTNVFSFVDLFV
jgi:adenine deaminase